MVHVPVGDHLVGVRDGGPIEGGRARDRQHTGRTAGTIDQQREFVFTGAERVDARCAARWRVISGRQAGRRQGQCHGQQAHD